MRVKKQGGSEDVGETGGEQRQSDELMPEKMVPQEGGKKDPLGQSQPEAEELELENEPLGLTMGKSLVEVTITVGLPW